MPLDFVNFRAERVSTSPPPDAPKPVKKEGPAEYHKGFLVEGIPPGALEEAQAERAKVITSAIKKGEKPPEDFDRTAWLIKAKRKRINARAYEILSSAEQCKALAEKSGWLGVTVRALANRARAT